MAEVRFVLRGNWLLRSLRDSAAVPSLIENYITNRSEEIYI